MPENKKIPWWEPQISDEDIRGVTEVLKSNFINEGEVTEEFEKKISETLGCKYTVAVPNCTLGLFAALKAAGVGKGDEVIVPDLTWIATANAAELAGAIPVFVDIDPKNLNIDPQSAERAITERTRAIIPVHVTGRGADMEAIMTLSKKYDLAVIEDAAEAFYSKYKGKYLGTWGQAGAFSLHPFKIITSGQGGFVTTNDKEIFLRLKMLKNQGKTEKGTGGDDIFKSIGYNLKFTNLQAAIALSQLKQIGFRADKIRKTRKIYQENLKPGTVNLFPFDIEGGELPLWIDGWTPKRDELHDYLHAHNITCRKFWHPIHRQKIYKAGSDRDFPESTRMAYQSIWLPSAFTMSDEDVITVCKHINDFFAKKHE